MFSEIVKTKIINMCKQRFTISDNVIVWDERYDEDVNLETYINKDKHKGIVKRWGNKKIINQSQKQPISHYLE